MLIVFSSMPLPPVMRNAKRHGGVRSDSLTMSLYHNSLQNEVKAATFMQHCVR